MNQKFTKYEQELFKWTKQRNYKKENMNSGINNKLEGGQCRKDLNGNLIKDIKERQKNNQGKWI